MDIRKEKAARAAEHNLHAEEDIDITDEAQNFQPVQVSRDETPREPKGNEVGGSEGEAGEDDEPEQETPIEDRIVYREAIMTDGILVEEIIHEVNKMAETGTCDLGAVIFSCEHAR